ncbi:DUF6340 family protein [Mariniflexile ostreae]|uniref:DUF6340 family protein n=1 Tax=Mariniflexile ostreae TaxID=1520892 RepID=A0ABV5FBX0_9FLAO
MKNVTRIVFSLGICIVLSACSATSQLTMGVKEPAKIPISSHVSRIGIINRSIPEEANKSLDKIDKILSLEGLMLDQLGANAALNGLKAELQRNGRFASVTHIDSLESIGKGLGVFPAQLSWDEIDNICKANQVDVIFSLEYYDTNATIQYEQKMVPIPNPLGIKANVPGHKITIRTALVNGWRVYDPYTKYILDEASYNDYIVSVGEGINPFKAVETIAGRKEAVIQSSHKLGATYGLNVSALTRQVTRKYYVKGGSNFEVAQRRAQTGDWDGASELWAKELNNPNPKIAGRACYNMAIINEINGDLDTAMVFAAKSYTDYKNKEALLYMDILKYRKNQVLQLDEEKY